MIIINRLINSTILLKVLFVCLLVLSSANSHAEVKERFICGYIFGFKTLDDAHGSCKSVPFVNAQSCQFELNNRYEDNRPPLNTTVFNEYWSPLAMCPSPGYNIDEHVCDEGFHFDNDTHTCIAGVDDNPDCSLTGQQNDPVDPSQCIDVIIEDKNMCSTCPDNTGPSNPINMGFGNKYALETDYTSAGPFPLIFSRTYNSNDAVRTGSVGEHWRHSYDRSLNLAGAIMIEVLREDGKVFTFIPNGSAWTSHPDVTDLLATNPDSVNDPGWQYSYTSSDDTVERYDSTGKLVSVTNRAGFSQSLFYDLSSPDGDGNSNTLDKVSVDISEDPVTGTERALYFTYDSNGRLSTLTDPAGEVYTYGYDGVGNLITVTYPDETPENSGDNPVRTYGYDEPGQTAISLPHAMTSITDENGDRFAEWSYDSEGRADSSKHLDGTIILELVDIVYGVDANGLLTATATTKDSSGVTLQTQVYTFEIHNGAIKTKNISGGPCVGCSNQNQDSTFDTNGFVASRTDFNGNVTTFINDARGLQTSRTEAVGTLDERTITTEWHADFRLPTKITEPGKITNFTYDAQGRLLERNEEIAP